MSKLYTAQEEIEQASLKSYKGKLYSVADLKTLEEDKSYTKLERLEFLSPIWTNEQLFGKEEWTALNKSSMFVKDCTKLVYIYIDLRVPTPIYTIGGADFSHAIWYVGQGTLGRSFSHTQISTDDEDYDDEGIITVSKDSLLTQYTLDYTKKDEPYAILFPCVGVNTDLARIIEANLIYVMRNLQHYTRGIPQLALTRPILNQRQEKAHLGEVFTKTGKLVNQSS